MYYHSYYNDGISHSKTLCRFWNHLIIESKASPEFDLEFSAAEEEEPAVDAHDFGFIRLRIGMPPSYKLIYKP